ncbi:MAG: DUF2848 domain-containing protein [Pseudomonadota bacterium]
MLDFQTPDGPLAVAIERLIVAGWTGRDDASVQHHIEELAAIGVPRPSKVPLFYEVSPTLATQADRIAVLGQETSGEVEPLVINAGGMLWLGLASDHTDRGLEAVSVAHAKQACPKVLGRALWPLAPLEDRLDQLALRSVIDDDVLYQEGLLAAILPLRSLIDAAGLPEGAAMLCGTLPAIGGVRSATRYRMSLIDAEGAAIQLEYRCEALPVIA